MPIKKVAATSHPHSVAGAIAKSIRASGNVDLQAIGAGAVNQAVKAISIAQDFLVKDCIEIITKISMIRIEVEEVSKTAVLLRVSKYDK